MRPLRSPPDDFEIRALACCERAARRASWQARNRRKGGNVCHSISFGKIEQRIGHADVD
jgi:hypothetical protein